jgi:dipeptidyl aminopeptidase/acylaminoacyl peptidase
MPHGGPSDRDSWGFDWLPQFYAARGFAVLQPEYRGSSGYGDAWYQNNGFKSWRIAIGDVTDAGRWLVSSGIADPRKLAIVGWSYGGYAALQAAVIAPDLFKAVVAVAPVTDLAMLKSESLNWSDNMLRSDFIGSGDHIREGSPAQNAQKIKAPVLLVHGTLDANVNFNQSTTMASRLRAAGGKVQLITFEGLDHQLPDSTARTKLLGESDAFLQSTLGL